MKKFTRSTKLLTGMGLAAFVLAGCVGQQLQVAKETKSTGGPFDKALYSGYLKLSQTEYSEADYGDSDTFADRAISSAKGQPPQPEEVGSRNIPPEHVGGLKSAYRELSKVIDKGAVKLPKLAALAQTSFDCWMQEQEEDMQPADIAACKDDFNYAMGALKAALAPKPKKKAAPKPKKMAKRYQKYIVLFGLGSAKISSKESKSLNKAVLSIDTAAPSRVIVSGHTDRSGSATFNMALSKKRANAVAAMLEENSSTDISGKIQVKAYGETRNAVDTGDGRREPKNRRVKIDVIRR